MAGRTHRGPAGRSQCGPHCGPQGRLCSADTVLEDVINPNKCIYMHWITRLLIFCLISDRLIHNVPLTTAANQRETLQLARKPAEHKLNFISCFESVSICRAFPGGSDSKESTCLYKRQGFNPRVGKILWRMEWQLTPVFLPGKSHRQRSLMGYSLWGRKDSDTTEHACTHIHNICKAFE